MADAAALQQTTAPVNGPRENNRRRRLAGAWQAGLRRTGVAVRPRPVPQRVQRGTLGSWTTGREEAAGA